MTVKKKDFHHHHHQHHASTFLWLVGTPFLIPFRTVLSCIAVPISHMSYTEYRPMVSCKVSFLEKTPPEGCDRIKDQTMSLSHYPENYNPFRLSLRKIGRNPP